MKLGTIMSLWGLYNLWNAARFAPTAIKTLFQLFATVLLFNWIDNPLSKIVRTWLAQPCRPPPPTSNLNLISSPLEVPSIQDKIIPL
jgi:hypothetical protein